VKLENVRVTKVGLVREHSRDKLEVTCEPPWGGHVIVFRVDDNHRMRETYTIGRAVDVEITPGLR